MKNQELLKNAKSIIRAICHADRQRLMSIIKDNNGITVTELYIKMKWEQSVCSQHLAILLKTGVIVVERDGKYRKYFFNDKKYEHIESCLELLVGQQTKRSSHNTFDLNKPSYENPA